MDGVLWGRATRRFKPRTRSAELASGSSGRGALGGGVVSPPGSGYASAMPFALGATLPRTVAEVARDLDLSPEEWTAVGRGKAKISLDAVGTTRRAGRLVLVSAITPNRAGVGKTTVSVGLSMALSKLGHSAVVCLREPSLGPVFGIKGGGTGGGLAQVQPAADINLHFTGDLHAVASAHNLLAALLDNALHFGTREIDPASVAWPRVLDVNDRALRRVTLGERERRESRFDITAASEVMAVLCLATSLEDLRARLARVVVAHDRTGRPVTARDLNAHEAMTALLADALCPNLVQTTEGTAALVHGGPFANIAHGCSSRMATVLGMGHADFVVTEAGFGFDLGGEKFLQIKCRGTDVWPSLVVLAVTAEALARHGDEVQAGPDLADASHVERGLAHLGKQIENVRAFGLEPVVALNVKPGDPPDALGAVERYGEQRGVRVARFTAFTDGGAGGVALAQAVIDAMPTRSPAPRHLYEPDAPLTDKIAAVSRTLYGAGKAVFTEAATRDLETVAACGLGNAPVCVAKTHLSLSDDAKRPGVPRDFDVTVRGLRPAAGAGFVVALLGDVVTMPGLPRAPAAERVRVLADGTVTGLMQGE